jgi:hypothetical protein
MYPKLSIPFLGCLTLVLTGIDINAPKKFNYGLFAAFTAVPGLAAQVRAWLAAN